MKVLHVVPSLDLAEGGPSVAVPLLARAVARRGHRVVILTTRGCQTSDIRHLRADRKRRTPNVQRATSNEEKAARGQGAQNRDQTSDVSSERFRERVVCGPWSVVKEDVEYIYARRNTRFYKVSWELVRWLRTNIRNFDLVHIHALFSFASTSTAFIAAKHNVPYIVRPLGVLNRWGLENRRAMLKRASLAVIERRILSRAAAVHYTSDAEKLEASKIGDWITNVPSFVVPLPVEAEKTEDRGQRSEGFVERFPEAKGKRIVLFLSRIDPKKGIELLLEAFSSVQKETENLLLVIAGSGDRHYEASLRQEADKLGIAQDVIWAGFVTGEDKAAALAAAEIFVLPSYSENFGIAAAEAFAAGKACVLSDQVGLAQDAGRANAAVVVPCDANALADAIRSVLANPEQQQRLGQAALLFATDRLSMAAVGEQLDEAYRAAIMAAKQTSNAQHRTSNVQ